MATLEQCLALLEAVDRYPTWYPEVVRDVEVLDRGPAGQPNRVRAKLHVKRGPIVKDFDLVMAVDVARPRTVKLSKVTNESSEQRFDVTWRLRNGAGTQIELDLYANLSVSRFVPLGGIGNSIAEGFVTDACRARAAIQEPGRGQNHGSTDRPPAQQIAALERVESNAGGRGGRQTRGVEASSSMVAPSVGLCTAASLLVVALSLA